MYLILTKQQISLIKAEVILCEVLSSNSRMENWEKSYTFITNITTKTHEKNSFYVYSKVPPSDLQCLSLSFFFTYRKFAYIKRAPSARP